jgi:hypothetical protein
VSGTTARQQGMAAYFSPATKMLVACEADYDTRGILRHEAFHQTLSYFVHNAPPWLNEGTATLMETSSRDALRLDPELVLSAKEHTDELPPLRTLLLMSKGDWDRGAWGPTYGSAATFIWFLHAQKKSELLDTYLRTLVRGGTSEEAFDRAFGKQDLTALERGWRKAVETGQYGS